MENMFSDKTNKKMPQTLSDCIKPDPTVTNLHLWAERLENWGHSLFCIIVFIGLVASISDAALAADEAYHDEEVIAFICSFAVSAFPWALYAFLEYCAYHAIALLISALACITQNTIITADIALLTALQQTGATSGDFANSHLENEIGFDPPPSANFVCPQCNHPVHQSDSACLNCGQPLGWSSAP